MDYVQELGITLVAKNNLRRMKPYVNKIGETVLEVSTREVREVIKRYWESKRPPLPKGWIVSLKLSPKYAIRIKDENKIVEKDDGTNNIISG